MKLLPGEKGVVGVQAMLDDGPTAPLDAFVAEYEKDDNIWWVVGCGHHQNLFEAAVAEVERLRALILREGYDSNRDCLVIYVDRAAAEEVRR